MDMQLASDGTAVATGILMEQVKRKHRIRKMLIAGSGAVGKTSLLNVLKHGTIANTPSEYHRTLFFNIDTLTISLPDGANNVGAFQVFDIAGQIDQPVHPFRDAGRLAFGGVDLILLVFSSDDLQSLLDIEKWIQLIENGFSEHHNGVRPKYVLVRNKIDLPDSIDHELVDLVLKSIPQIQAYYETSCITGEGIDKLKRWLIDHFT